MLSLFSQLLELIKERPNVCNQIHLPAQSGSTEVLDSMRRGYERLKTHPALYSSAGEKCANTK